MSLISKFFHWIAPGSREDSESTPRELLGCWETDPADTSSLQQFGKVRMEFRDDGTLRYIVSEGDKMQIIDLVYRVDGDVLVTDQPSRPRVEKTRFELTGHSLRLYSGPTPAQYRKVTTANK